MIERDTWNPAQYERFRREREQPFHDLLALVRPVPDMRAVDLGCGTGDLTRLLHARLRARQTLGIDRSPRMLERGATDLPAGLHFTVGTIEAFAADGAYDLVFSNAALHWVDDHPGLLARLTRALAPGGQLAFQVPAMFDDAPHRVAEEVAATEPFVSALGGWRRRRSVLAPAEYARLLFRLEFPEQHVRLVVYPHVLDGPEQVIEWVKGTLLTDYERRLPSALTGAFVDAFRARLLAELEPVRPFFFPFKRILCWAGGAHQPRGTSRHEPC